ncbi:zinc metalloprotease HtpX [Desulfotomaculum sp. 1211_IL3151]|uniref:zinc metalloprotease HtpX n=1 Tax=Desulfotomaculum sp. 1211_IL3151 TaxID=3084055 RepID=UPI002FDA4B8B
MNTLKVWLLMGALSIIMVTMGNAIGGSSGAMIFFLIAMAMNFFGYFYSDKMAIKMTQSYPVSEAEAPELYEMIRRLSKRAGLPMPRIYIQPSDQPNAFATGRNPENSAVAVTEGILRLMNPQELEGVLAHELAHIKNRDILIGTIAAAFAGAISMMGSALQWGAIFGMGRSEDEEGGGSMVGGLIMAIIFPIAAMIIQMAISRSREYSADATGAEIAGLPDGLANALLKLESAAQRVPMNNVNPATSHLFITNPLSGNSLARMFSTHPPIEERVQRLRGMRR